MDFVRYLLSSVCMIISVLLLSACSESQYLAQCAQGHLELMSRAEPIEDILARDTETEAVRGQLAKIVEIREFAISSLHLPDSGSYQTYVDLKRPYVVWNVVAAPEFSLDLKQWCYPIVGCVTYRGYFNEAAARDMAKTLTDQGFDVDVYGVQAYSTLSWFDDPVLNTFLQNGDIQLAALIFHEMAHQVLYVQHDTVFNESFAKTVEIEGLRRWLKESESHELWQQFLRLERQSADFNKFLGSVRDELNHLYAKPLEIEQKKLAKQEVIAHAFERYLHLKQGWGGDKGFDDWMEGGLNNARLSSMATYYDLVPPLQNLLIQADYDLNEFYTKVKEISLLSKGERLTILKEHH